MADINFNNFKKKLLEGSIKTINGNYSVSLMSSESSFTVDDISISQEDYNAWMIAVMPLNTYVELVSDKYLWKADKITFPGEIIGARGALVHSNDLGDLVRFSDFGRSVDTSDEMKLNFNNGIISI